MSGHRKTYLVTGGTGFIGSATVRRLARDGHRVRVIDNDSRGAVGRLADVQGLEIVRADIRDPDAVARACDGVDSVVHMAFVNGTEFFYSKPDLVLDVGVRGMVNVLDGCRRHGVRELVLASSSEVYQTPPRVPTDESAPLLIPDPLNPRYSYAAGKIISEIMAVNYGRTHFDRVLIFRPHNVYGPDMGWEHVVPQFVLRMKRSVDAHQGTGPVPFPIQGTGAETRAFVYIDDFVDGLSVMLEKGEHLGIYHIGTPEEISIADLAKLVGEFFGRTVTIIPGQLAAGGTLRRCPDIAKLAALGFRPKVPIRDGLAATALWYDAHADHAPQAWTIPSNDPHSGDAR